MPDSSIFDDHRRRVVDYYHRTESRVGYKYLTAETKHFGYYDPGQRAFPFGRALRRMEHELAEALQVTVDDTVLDAGAGTGVVACEVAGATGATVVGIDILDFNVARARDRATELGVADRVTFEEMDYSTLDFPDSSFDAVYTCETLVHAIDAAAVIAQFHRVLRPGGRLVLLEYSRQSAESMPEDANIAFERVNRLAAMPAFQHTFVHGALASMLRESGLLDVSERDLTSNILPMLRAFKRIAAVPFAIVRRSGLDHKAVNAMSAVEFYKHRAYFRYVMITAAKASPSDS